MTPEEVVDQEMRRFHADESIRPLLMDVAQGRLTTEEATQPMVHELEELIDLIQRVEDQSTKEPPPPT